ncbi:tRNA 2-selenouridine(34) synthase MnmH [Guyparkeria halophila]|uniref:tRNA 2-selenouridine synthase n=1 Tax=Guyparkeria halophila TaxID=47960 RepID=A0ABZ0YYM1_9GAMM|nr:tRNA 2-selenouridine(34) synthase MnmH [Guyparkeria halophila]WQH16474.1 tRNA 2-selenouridine(34) synthase MnmH [Guyparkeria halophila]
MSGRVDLPLVTDMASVFLDDRPLLDVRAPVEFAQGAFPGAKNRPLLTDEERHQVGIRYKEAGQDAAIALGYELVDAQEKARRVAEWQAFAAAHPDGLLYCFRGGLRSRLTQQMLFDEAGITYPRVAGGYKAMRRFLLDALETQAVDAPLIMLGGRTGVGKTPFLTRFERHLDLEGRARHKGSAFGREPEPQPMPIDFENQVAIDLLRLRQRSPDEPILVEDEGKMVGARLVPPTLFERMRVSPLVVIERPLDERVEQSLKDYIIDLEAGYRRVLATDASGASAQVREHILGAIDRVAKRLGGVRHAKVRGMAEEALDAWYGRDDVQGLRDLIRVMLVEYYDPMYDYQLANKRDRIAFSGPPEAVAEELIARGLRPQRPI